MKTDDEPEGVAQPPSMPSDSRPAQTLPVQLESPFASRTINNLDELLKVTADFDATLDAVPLVEEISIQDEGRNLGHVPCLVFEMTRLISLDLRGCGLVHIPWNVSNLVVLKDLNVSRNELVCLPKELGAMHNLNDLDASFNKMTQVHPAVFDATSLTALNLMANKLTQLPDTLGQLTGLIRLGLKSNQLTSLPASFTNLTNLVELFITDNQLTRLPEGFGSLAALVKVQASFNRLTSLPPDIWHMPRLEMLRVAVCDLTYLAPGSALMQGGGPPRLAWFSLGGNAAAGPPPDRPPDLGVLPVIDRHDLHVGGQLGSGASGEVYSAEWRGRQVALKMFRGDTSPDGQIADEIAIACAVHHPQLTEVLGVVMAVVVGDSLPSIRGLVLRLDAGRPLASKPTSQHLLRCKWEPAALISCQALITICSHVCSALAYLHSRHMCHGDVYAHNLLVCGPEQHWNTVLCDFGAAFTYPENMRSFWEAMEVRAFGLMLKDMVQRLDSLQPSKVPATTPPTTTTPLHTNPSPTTSSPSSPPPPTSAPSSDPHTLQPPSSSSKHAPHNHADTHRHAKVRQKTWFSSDLPPDGEASDGDESPRQGGESSGAGGEGGLELRLPEPGPVESSLQSLVDACLREDMRERPSFREVVSQLEQCQAMLVTATSL